MRFGLQIPNFTTNQTPGLLFEGVVDMASAAEEVWLRLRLGDGPLLPTAAVGRAEPADARFLHAARRPGNAEHHTCGWAPW